VTLRLLNRMVGSNVSMTLAYRGAFFVLMLATVISPLISLLVWLTVTEHSRSLPLDRSQFVTYYVLLGVTAMLTSSWIAPYVSRDIRLGQLSPWLLRPAPVMFGAIANNLGEKVVKLPLIAPLVALTGLLFWPDLRPPTDPAAWALYLLCLPLAAATAFLLDYVLGSLAFWVNDVVGLHRVKELLSAFLAGRYVPLALFPAWAGGALEAQPFRYTLSFPLEVLTGALGPDALARGFAWQLGYPLGLALLCRLLWRYGLRTYSASGG
jgi:ABC-2 type transport system permease protein